MKPPRNAEEDELLRNADGREGAQKTQRRTRSRQENAEEDEKLPRKQEGTKEDVRDHRDVVGDRNEDVGDHD